MIITPVVGLLKTEAWKGAETLGYSVPFASDTVESSMEKSKCKQQFAEFQKIFCLEARAESAFTESILINSSIAKNAYAFERPQF